MMERRTRRSHDPMSALELYLERIATRNQLGAVVVSDKKGRMVGGVGLMVDLRDLGQLGSDLVSGKSVGTEFERVTAGDDLYVREVVVGSQAFVLSSLGGRIRRVGETSDALSRILAS